jgi:uncharacterized membrane protein YdfJ with MMPL/SSD domain
MFSDWIIIGALVLLVGVVVLFFTSGAADTQISSGTGSPNADTRSKDAAKSS